MTRALPLLLLLASLASADGRGAAPPPPELTEARKKVYEEIQKLKASMAQQGYRAEIEDCDSILRKVLEPEKGLNEKGGGTPYPGDDRLKALIQEWSEFGDRVAAIYTDAAAKLDGDAKAEAELMSGWFASFAHAGRGVLHLNRRRKFCKLTPVMPDWSGTLGGYLHGVYLKRNQGHPSTAGLGAHNEDPKLPGYTLEGAAAAKGILGGGSAEYVMDSWLGSEYHREPVFSRGCTRVLFGGLPGGWWSCRNGGGGSGNALADVITFPGDGDTDISPVFGGEGPNPLDRYGMQSSGTLIVIEFLKGKPKKGVARLLDPDGKEVEILELGKAPMSFVAREPLQKNARYVVEVVGTDRRFSFSFTTSGGFGIGMGGRGADPNEGKAPVGGGTPSDENSGR
ncbi:MAG: hypothetical protein HUU15_07905 [Candidatus Brocadiae bacterium]|nr:hypothetical protein [Candidatus Brocadiia bacterium]